MRRAGVILLLVCFDDDGTRREGEGRPLLVEDGGPLDEGGSDDILGNDRDDGAMDGDVLLLFFIAGSTDEVSIEAEMSNLRLLNAEITVDDSASLSISIRLTMFLIAVRNTVTISDYMHIFNFLFNILLSPFLTSFTIIFYQRYV